MSEEYKERVKVTRFPDAVTITKTVSAYGMHTTESMNFTKKQARALVKKLERELR